MKLVIEIEDWKSPKDDDIELEMKYKISSELKETDDERASLSRDLVNEELAQQISRYAELKNEIRNLLFDYYLDLNSKGSLQRV